MVVTFPHPEVTSRYLFGTPWMPEFGHLLVRLAHICTCIHAFQVLQLVRLAHPPDAVRLANYICVYIYIIVPCVLCLQKKQCVLVLELMRGATPKKNNVTRPT